MKLTEHFDLDEFRCHDGTAVPPELVERTKALCDVLEIVRDKAGAKPLTIVSGYRSPAYNVKVDGAQHSQHMEARAADIAIAGMTPDEVADLCEQLTTDGAIPVGGLGRYAGWTHIDIRGYRARWDCRVTGERG